MVSDKPRPIYYREITLVPHFTGAGMDGGEEEKVPFSQRGLNPEP
jgi:hypothetical protein